MGEEEGEAGFMQDRRVVERDPDQDGGERNGDTGDLRMTLKNDLANANNVHESERIVRRKEDVEKNGENEERRIVVKDEKEVEERVSLGTDTGGTESEMDTEIETDTENEMDIGNEMATRREREEMTEMVTETEREENLTETERGLGTGKGERTKETGVGLTERRRCMRDPIEEETITGWTMNGLERKTEKC